MKRFWRRKDPEHRWNDRKKTERRTPPPLEHFPFHEGREKKV